MTEILNDYKIKSSFDSDLFNFTALSEFLFVFYFKSKRT